MARLPTLWRVLVMLMFGKHPMAFESRLAFALYLRRGLWASINTLRRYHKPGRIDQSLAPLSPQLKAESSSSALLVTQYPWELWSCT